MVAQSDFISYCKTMLSNIKVYARDKLWNQIFADLGMCVVNDIDTADVVFDDINIKMPISVTDLKNIIFTRTDNSDIIRNVFAENILLPSLQHKIIVILYKKPNLTIHELKIAVGVSPDITTHTVENAIYQLRKKYGRDIIQNINGKYRIGHL